MRFAYRSVLTGLALLSMATTAHAQSPTKAQQDALRSNCRSDFMRNCSSVTPGGREALECLMQNKAKLSGACQGALNAISAPAAAKPEPKPEPKAAAKPEPKPELKAAAPKAAAPKPATASPAPAATAPAAPPPAAPAAKKPAKPTKAASPARPQVTPPPPSVAAPAPAAVAPAPSQTHQPKLGEAILIRRFCGMDFRVLCKGVPLGQGRAVQCLANNAAALSPGCREMMTRTGELRP